MKKLPLHILVISLFITLTGCANNLSTQIPANEKTTNAAVTSTIVLPIATATFTPDILTPTLIDPNLRTYIDPDLGFRLQFDPSWQLIANPGTRMGYNDGKGRTVQISKDGYTFQLMVVDGPGDVHGCAGMFGEDRLNGYWIYKVDNVELWRMKAEQGYLNGYNDSHTSFVDIISPLVLFEKPDPSGF